MSELDVLRMEYKSAQKQPLFDNPQLYCILLDVIQDKIERLEHGKQ
jgi:hypothetical protein